MKLTTERLHLSLVSMQDLEAVHDLHSLPETDRYNTMGIPADIGATQRLIEEWIALSLELPVKKYVFRIQTTANAFVGITGINIGRPHYRDAEIWYKLHPDQWNNGYATEAVKAILQLCFGELNLHRVQAGCVTENVASVRVLEKSGFLREGHCRKKLPIRGEWKDNYEFAILREAYESARSL
jgi:ribosomal-protein-alanine N-acetyltransferase